MPLPPEMTIAEAIASADEYLAMAAASGYGVRAGRNGMAEFFADSGSAMEVEEFTPALLLPMEAGVPIPLPPTC